MGFVFKMSRRREFSHRATTRGNISICRLLSNSSIHFSSFTKQGSSLKYLHLDEGIFCRVRRLAWCNDPESYAGGGVATGRATLAGQVKGEHPDKERYTGPPGWGLGRWASTPSHGKKKHTC